MALSLVRRRAIFAGAATSATPTFKIAANVGKTADYFSEPVYIDLVRAIRGFGTVSDQLRNTSARPALNATDRWPAEDFGLVIPLIPTSASPQTLKCKLLGLGTIAVSNNAAYSLSNITPSGDDTTFDLNITAGASTTQGILTFTSTKRTAASSTNTGCRGLIIKMPGFSIADTTLLMPNVSASLARFSTLRFMDIAGVNNNMYTVAVADRATDANRPYKPGYTNTNQISVEDAVRTCNALNKNLWWTIPAAANDALITDMATVIKNNLNSNLYCVFELANENWNLFFTQGPYWIAKALEEVNGMSWQYGGEGSWNSMEAITVASNVVTLEFKHPHNLSTGDKIHVSSVSGWPVGTTGIKTLTGTPTTTSVTYSEVLTNTAKTLVDTGNVYFGKILLQATRTSNVATYECGKPHNLTNGQTVRVNGFNGTSAGAQTVTVIDARNFSVPSTGADGAVPIGGSNSLVGDFTTSNLNNYDSGYDQFVLGRRLYARRTVEMANILKTIYTNPGDFGTRCRVGLFNQPGSNQGDQLNFINTQYGPPKNYLYAIGKATYYFLDASTYGGANLQSVTSFNGNTPPSIADYLANWDLTAQAAPSSTEDIYDATVAHAAIYDLKAMAYEFGPDAAGTTSQAGAQANASQRKLDALFDPSAKPMHRRIINQFEQGGFEEVCVYNAGTCAVGENNVANCWPIFRQYNVATCRTDAIDEHLAAARTGPTRNMLNASGSTIIDPRLNWGKYVAAGGYPNLGGVAPYTGAVAQQNWVVTSPVAGNFTLTIDFTTATQATECRLLVNGVNTGGDIPLPVGTSQLVARPITLKKGINSIRITQGDLFLGSLSQATNFTFTKV